MIVDAINEHETRRRLVAVKNVTVNEEFFQGHFPGAPLMPGVLMLESLSQVAAILLLERGEDPPNARAYLLGVNDAKFRKQVVPGDRLRLEITLGRRRKSLALARATAYLDDQVVAECQLLMGLVDPTEIDGSDRNLPPKSRRDTIGPHATIGPRSGSGPLQGGRVRRR